MSCGNSFKHPISGGTVYYNIENASNIANSSSGIATIVGGSSAGDPFHTFTVSGGASFTEGIDNSDVDKYKISASASLGTTDTQIITTAGEVTFPLTPAFSAYLNTTVTNVTGNGANYLVIFDTEIFDQNADFNLGTGTFVAPIGGRYFFETHLIVIGTTIATTFDLALISSNRAYIQSFQRTASANNQNVELAVLADMDAGDTITVNINVGGEAGNTDDIAGNPNSYTGFSGYLAC